MKMMYNRDIQNRLRKEGWAQRNGKGSHVIYRHQDGRQIMLSNKYGRQELPPWIIHKISKTAGWK